MTPTKKRRPGGPAAWTAADVMSTPVFQVERGLSIREAADRMSARRISGALVVDETEKPLGVITLVDIVNCLAGRPCVDEEATSFYTHPRPAGVGQLWEKLWWNEPTERALKQIPVEEIMSYAIVSVPEETSLQEVARHMARRHIHRVFVARGDRIVGVVTTTDILRVLVRGPMRARRRQPRRRR